MQRHEGAAGELSALLLVLALVVRVGGDGGAHLLNVGAMNTDGLVEGFAGDAEVFAPVMDIGGDFGIDLVGAAWAVLYILGHLLSFPGTGLILREVGCSVGLG